MVASDDDVGVAGKRWAGRVSKTYETKRKDGHGRHGMQQHAHTEDAEISRGDHQVPEEIAGGQTLQEAAGTIIAPYAAGPIHVGTLLVVEYEVQGEGVDDERLGERDNMDVPVQTGALVKLGIDGREETSRDPGGDGGEEELVEGKGEDYLVDVEGEGGKRGCACQRRG